MKLIVETWDEDNKIVKIIPIEVIADTPGKKEVLMNIVKIINNLGSKYYLSIQE